MRKRLIVALLVGFTLAMALLTFTTVNDFLSLERFRARVSELAGSGAPTDNESLDAYYKSATSSEFTDRWVKLR